jgi:hypothetical protein
MELDRIFAACQADRLADWCLIPPGDAETDLLHGLVASMDTRHDDSGEAHESATVTTYHHNYRAVYLPDARLGIGFGMWTHETEDWLERDRHEHLDWIPFYWKRALPQTAHLLLNGVMVWRLTYTYIDQGAATEVSLPWPDREYETDEDPLEPHRPSGWTTTRWEVEFVRLLNELRGIPQQRFEDGLKGYGLEIRDRTPLDEAKPPTEH